jgi:hypothetical protein
MIARETARHVPIEDGDEVPVAIADGVQVDPRLSLLVRASAMFDLVQAGLLELDEAFDAVERACHALRPCHCEVATLQAWERYDQKIREERLRSWRVRPAPKPPWPRRRP